MQQSKVHKQRQDAREQALQARIGHAGKRQEPPQNSRQTEAHLRSIFRSAPVGIGLVANRVILEVNNRLCTMVGYTADELVGRNARLLYLSDEDCNRVDGEKYRQIAEHGTVETRWRRKNGAVIDVLLSSTPLDRNDLSQGVTFTALDITARKQAEDELQSIFDLSLDMVCIADINSATFVRVNPAFERTLGYRQEDLLGRPFLDFIHPDDVDATRAIVQEKLPKGGSVINFENRYRCKDGTYRWLNWTSHPKPERGLTYAVARDTTEQKRDEQALRESEQRFRPLFEDANDGSIERGKDISERKRAEAETKRLTAILEATSDLVSWASPDAKIKYINRAGRAMLGLAEGDAALSSQIRDFHPDWALRLIREEGMPQAIENGTWSGKTAVLSPDGQEIPVSQVIMSHRAEDGTLDYFSTIMRDLTEQKGAETALRESETRFRELAEMLPQVVFEIDAAGNFTFANHAGLQNFGYTRAELDDLDVLALFTPECRERIAQSIQKRLQDEPVANREYQALRKDGSTFPVLLYASPIIRDGTAVGLRGIGLDIAERKQAEQDRQARLHHLESMERINTIICEATDVERMMHDVIEATQAIFESDRAWLLHPCDPEAASIQVPVECTRPEYPGVSSLEQEVPIQPGQAREMREALASEDPCTYLVDTDKPVATETAAQFGVQSQIQTAIYPKVGRPWMFGLHQCSHRRVWTTEEQLLFKEISHRIADGLSSLLSLRELKESETRFRDLAELLPQTVFELDSEGRFTFVSHMASETFGYDRDELSTLSAMDMFAPEERERIRENLGKRLRGEQFGDHEYTARKKDGTTFPVLAYSTPIRRDGVAAGLRGILVDITERQCAERAIQESKAKLESILESSPNAICVTDLNGNIVDCNRATLDMHGHETKGALLGRSMFGFIAETDRLKARMNLETTRTQGSTADVELLFLKKDGRAFPCEVSTSVMRDPSSEAIGFVAAMADIAERKQAREALRKSEEKYRSLIANIPDVVWTSDEHGKITFMSPNIEHLCGYRPDDLCGRPGQPWFDKIHADDLERVRQAEKRLFQEGTPLDVEYRFQKKDGQWIWLQDRSTGTYEKGGVRYTDGVFVDVTERRRLEQALERRLVALTRPLSDTAGVEFDELFDLGEIQNLQDLFAKATGVASIITHPDGTPITKPSNFCHLCENIIRQTPEGLKNCHYSDSVIGSHTLEGPTVQPCLSGGLWDAGASITVGGKHIANWLIGQVRNEAQDETKMREYARQIGADVDTFMAAFREVPTMSEGQFRRVADALFAIAERLSTTAYQNVQQARFISERKRAQEDLAQERNLLRTLIDNLPDSTYIKDRDSRFLLCSRQTARAAGVDSAEQVIGKTDFDFYHPELARGLFEEEQQLMQSGEALLNVERCVVDPVTNGPVWDLTTKVPLRDAKGQIVGLVGISRDITEQKLSQEALRESLQTSSDIVASIPSGLLLYRYTPPDTLTLIDANPAATQLLGINLHQYIGWDFNDLWPQAREAGLTDAYLNVMRTGQMLGNEDIAYEDDKVSGIFTTRAFRILGDRLCVAFENVTERTRARQRVQGYQQKLKSLASELSLAEERERRRMAAGLHDHACQNLVLSNMKLQGLRLSLPAGPAQTVETVCQTLKETIEGVRELTFDLSSPTLYKFGLSAALEELLKDKLRREHAIHYQFSDDGQPKPLSQDVLVLLFQSVRELLINTIKHAQAHEVALDIRRESGSIQITLTDDGTGFDVDEILSYPPQKRSVGLFNILERLDYVGGSLDMESQPGKGSRFLLVAPLATEVPNAKESHDGSENSTR
ncbi:MAG: PAS domain S-box protein [Phycisphaerales bacterium]|nr:MAG: PAS domain S-box protein [Phycisphaerales bacterium]